MPHSFPYSANAQSKILILGSMPGAESLKRQEYYAFKYNAFWPIMGRLFNFDTVLPYQQRLSELLRHGIALWDVLAYCERKGSLDSAIRNDKPNDILHFLESHKDITHIFCNGTSSFTSLKRHFPSLFSDASSIRIIKLVSTSPAAAQFTFDEKLAMYKIIPEILLRKKI